jgi:hypothetical protein
MTRGKSEEGAELIGFTDIAGFAGVENGSAVVKPLEVSVNKEMAGLPTKFSQRIHGERIEVYKRTLPAKSSGQMSAVEKQWKEEQKPFEQVIGKMESPSRNYKEPETSGEYEPPTKEYGYPKGASMADSPLGQLKNHVDNIHSWVRYIGAGLLITAIIASVALGGVIFK